MHYIIRYQEGDSFKYKLADENNIDSVEVELRDKGINQYTIRCNPIPFEEYFRDTAGIYLSDMPLDLYYANSQDINN